jgi:UDP-N-acetylglucosamine 1-carboxyvinyltransferase
VDKFIVKGGQPLRGRIAISGSKNSALPILAATLLTPEKCVIHRVPDLSDVRYMLEIIKYLGAEVEFKNGTVTVRAEKIHSEAPYDLVRKMRASICVLGPLLARCGHVKVSVPGGCVIGDRPIDIHLRGIQALGAQVTTEEGNVMAEAKRLRGAVIPLGGKFGSTVLGTDNIMMAATRAEGTTVIDYAACEPEVVDLADFLTKMGAKIKGQGSRRLNIEGVETLHGCEHTVIADRIEAGTFVVAALISQGDLILEGTQQRHLARMLEVLQISGAHIEEQDQGLRVLANGPLSPVDLITETYPGFPTDMQAQFCALMCVTPGESLITEKIFPHRFMHLSELKRMGAQIELEGATVRISGVEALSGAPVMASDLRASAALVLAGLAAKGATEVHRVYHIDRGYEHIDAKLRGVGADIERVSDQGAPPLAED